MQVGATLTVDIAAADPDGPAPLVLGAAPLPGTAAFTDNGDGTGRLIWTPSAGDVAASPYSLVVTASDGAGATDSETVAVTVIESAPVNQPPQLDPIGARTVQVGATLTVDIAAADPDGPAPLVLGAAPLPGTAAFTDNGDGTGRLIWTPSAGDVAASPYSLVVTASDGAGATDSETVAVTVLPASGGTGQLQTTLSATASPVNLTAEARSTGCTGGAVRPPTSTARPARRRRSAP
ncbi:Ig-like domain-containing protein [Thiocapsa sp.]|uniref:Ig-like domain-containing protein n=1 Tax=Thiocapsa sp. TaxID=2024551 RepID=UPI001BD09789|nr:Ig-like domain-containing protein [Thiocapsa sp.]